MELLAWLTGYQQRPYEYGQTYKIEGDEKPPKKVIKEVSNEKNTNWQKYAVIVLVLLLSGGGYMLFKGNKPQKDRRVVNVAKSGPYMHWTGDH